MIVRIKVGVKMLPEIVGGFLLGGYATVFVINFGCYYREKQHLVNQAIDEGRERTFGYISDEDNLYHSPISKLFDFGPSLAHKRFKTGKFDHLLK